MPAIKPRFNVAFPPEVMAELSALVPSRERNRFVVEATRERLRRERLGRALEDARRDPIWKEEDHPDLKTPEDVAAYVRRSRDRWTARRLDDE